MEVEEKTFRFFEVSFWLMAIIILIMLSIVVYFINLKLNPYDVNRDGLIDKNDIIEIQKVIGEEK